MEDFPRALPGRCGCVGSLSQRGKSHQVLCKELESNLRWPSAESRLSTHIREKGQKERRQVCHGRAESWEYKHLCIVDQVACTSEKNES